MSKGKTKHSQKIKNYIYNEIGSDYEVTFKDLEKREAFYDVFIKLDEGVCIKAQCDLRNSEPYAFTFKVKTLEKELISLSPYVFIRLKEIITFYEDQKSFFETNVNNITKELLKIAKVKEEIKALKKDFYNKSKYYSND